MADTLKPQLCIIGAGALGTGLAIAARERGADVLLIDRGPEPGDGGEASLQRLALLSAAAAAHAQRTGNRFGLDSTEPKPSYKTISERAAAVALATAAASAPDRLVALGIKVLPGVPAFVDRTTLKVGDALIKPHHLILATGSRPVTPEFPGHDAVSCFTPETILDNTRKLSHLVVIGSGADAFELAQAYRRLGSDVTLVPQGPVLPGFDREAVAILIRELTAEGIAVLDGASVTAIQPRSQGTGIAIRRADGSDDALDVSHILLALGREPIIDAALFDKARLKPDPAHPGRPLLDARGQTSNTRISFVGPAAGHDDPALIDAHARAVLDRALGASFNFNPLRVLRHVRTSPAIAQTGQLDGDRKLRPGEKLLRANPAETDAARAVGQTAGSAKLLVTAKGAIIGGVMVGAGAVETMAIVAFAIERNLPLAQLGSLILPSTSPAAVLSMLVRSDGAGNPTARWRPAAGLRRLLP
jgi:pyruvate/2-oxoglutarate dehydrogenase complex dihydrolipoamide dehydrogenase (E3) component